MPHPTAVLLVVALSRSLLRRSCPRLRAFADAHTVRTLRPPLPAVTCTVQASMLTGTPVRDHGIVANGWFDRALGEIQFWKQSNRLIAPEKVWETARRRDPSVTSAVLFWWFNMFTTADWAVTPRPIYTADGRKIPDIYTRPPELRERLQRELGRFPLFRFWGPGASIESSRWIRDAAHIVADTCRPSLNLIYLPHLDYALQKFGPGTPQADHALTEIDAVVYDLLHWFDSHNVRTIIVSEYGIEPVHAPIWINRTLRDAGLLTVRMELGRELLDPVASRALAVADHQIAHVYVRDPDDLTRVAAICRDLPGVELVLDRDAQRRLAVDHPRAGDLLLVARPGRWFAYGYWFDDARAPDFARTVDIHRKPGFDPCELFINPALRAPRWRIAWKLARSRLGLRTLLDVIPLDASLVRGSHGRVDVEPDLAPLLITPRPMPHRPDPIPAESVRDVILEHLFDD